MIALTRVPELASWTFDPDARTVTLGAPGIEIDLSRVTFVDSKGLSALLESHREAGSRDMTLRVVNPQPTVARLFRITGVDTVLADGEASI